MSVMIEQQAQLLAALGHQGHAQGQLAAAPPAADAAQAPAAEPGAAGGPQAAEGVESEGGGAALSTAVSTEVPEESAEGPGC